MGTAFNSGLGTTVTDGDREVRTNVTNKELEYLSSVVPGVTAAVKAVVLDSSGKIDTIDMTAWKIGGTTVTASASEINSGLSSVFNIKSSPYNATGDGVADDGPAIKAAIDACAAAGGGTVYFPPGTFLVGATPTVLVWGDTHVPGIHLRGAGVGATTIKLKDNSDLHVVVFQDTTDCSLSNMTIDGNSANQTAGSGVHGFNVGGGALRLTLRDLHIHDTVMYGIGLQSGLLDSIVIDKILLVDTGGDGIDFKNDQNTNARSTISNVSVIRPSRSAETGPQGSGIDLRGPVDLVNIAVYVDGLRLNTTGISFQFTDGVGSNGIGAHHSTLTNFRVIGTGVGLASTAVGVRSQGTEVMISNGYIEGLVNGILIQTGGDRDKIVNVTTKDCLDQGIYIQADEVNVINCNVLDSTTTGGGVGRGIRIEGASALVQGNTITGCTDAGIRVVSDGTGSRIFDNYFAGNGSNVDLISVSGIPSRDNIGWVTENFGTTNVADGGTINHGLTAEPTQLLVAGTVGGDILTVGTKTSTTFVVAIKLHDGTAGTTQNVYWQAKIKY